MSFSPTRIKALKLLAPLLLAVAYFRLGFNRVGGMSSFYNVGFGWTFWSSSIEPAAFVSGGIITALGGRTSQMRELQMFGSSLIAGTFWWLVFCSGALLISKAIRRVRC